MEVYPIPGFQEPFSSFSHLFAVPVFLVLGFVLIRRGLASGGSVVSLVILVFSTVFLLSMSGVYHLLGPGTGRYVLEILDVAAVFTMIAGTATPVHAILFVGIFRWLPLLLAWVVAATGIALRSIFPESLPYGVGTMIFLVMGWGGLVTFVLVWKQFGIEFAKPLLWGGLAYTIGAVVMLLHQPTVIPGILGPHELWHIAVLCGIGLHWSFVFSFAHGPPDSIHRNKNGWEIEQEVTETASCSGNVAETNASFAPRSLAE